MAGSTKQKVIDLILECLASSKGPSSEEIKYGVHRNLALKGLDPHVEYWVPDRGDGRRGRIDLHFTLDGIDCYIEFNRCNPRAKSLHKLHSLPDSSMKLVVLAAANEIITEIDGIPVVCFSPALRVSRRRYRGAISSDKWEHKARLLRANFDTHLAEIRELQRQNPIVSMDAYMRSARWKRLRDLLIAKAKNVCVRCRKRFKKSRLIVRHLSYDRVGEEDLKDLEVVCAKCSGRFAQVTSA